MHACSTWLAPDPLSVSLYPLAYTRQVHISQLRVAGSTTQNLLHFIPPTEWILLLRMALRLLQVLGLVYEFRHVNGGQAGWLTRIPGMGREIALLLAGRGCTKFLLADIVQGALEETKSCVLEISSDAQVVTQATDVSKDAAVKSMVETCVSAFGRLNIAINCAGIARGSVRTVDTTAEEFKQLCNVNEKGVSRRANLTMLKNSDSRFLGLPVRKTRDYPVSETRACHHTKSSIRASCKGCHCQYRFHSGNRCYRGACSIY